MPFSGQRGLGDVRRCGVPEVRSERGDDADAPRRRRLQVLEVDLDPGDALSSASVRNAVVIQLMPWRRLCAITGSKAFSCSCPASAAMVTVMSLPITLERHLVHHLGNDRVDLARA